MSDRASDRADISGVSCSESPSHDETCVHILNARVGTLEASRAHLEEKVRELRAEQQSLLERCVSMEDQNATLTTLYVACQRLHSTLNWSEVLQTVREIIANLVGCEEYVLFNLGDDGWLRRVDSFGVATELYQKVLPGHGLIGRSIETGDAYVAGECDGSAATLMDANLTVCVPLKRNGVVTGAIALFRLLPQKLELQPLDRELFRLLETHLATALYCTELARRAGTENGDAA
jgi:nitrate/nitrite-specific signal transduction histidine kinase